MCLVMTSAQVMRCLREHCIRGLVTLRAHSRLRGNPMSALVESGSQQNGGRSESRIDPCSKCKYELLSTCIARLVKTGHHVNFTTNLVRSRFE
jgi:hypothetical protein